MLVFASMGVLAHTGEPIVLAVDTPLSLTADAAHECCCTVDSADAICTCCTTSTEASPDEASNCCSSAGQECASNGQVQVSVQLSAYLTTHDAWQNPSTSSALTTIPDQRPEDALARSIDHVPKHSLS